MSWVHFFPSILQMGNMGLREGKETAHRHTAMKRQNSDVCPAGGPLQLQSLGWYPLKSAQALVCPLHSIICPGTLWKPIASLCTDDYIYLAPKPLLCQLYTISSY